MKDEGGYAQFCKNCMESHKPGLCGAGRKSNVLNTKNMNMFKAKQAEYGTFQVCSGGHYFKLCDTSQHLASCCLFDCSKFVNMPFNDQVKKVEESKSCTACTDWTHSHEKCPTRSRVCGTKGTNSQECTRNQNCLLHESSSKYDNLVSTEGKVSSFEEEPVAMLLNMFDHVFWPQ